MIRIAYIFTLDTDIQQVESSSWLHRATVRLQRMLQRVNYFIYQLTERVSDGLGSLAAPVAQEARKAVHQMNEP